jgi:hypothetical protein
MPQAFKNDIFYGLALIPLAGSGGGITPRILCKTESCHRYREKNSQTSAHAHSSNKNPSDFSFA